MRRIVFGSALLTLITAGAVATLAADRCGPSNSGASAQAKSGASCNTSAGAACEAPKGKLTGRFGWVQSGGVRFPRRRRSTSSPARREPPPPVRIDRA